MTNPAGHSFKVDFDAGAVRWLEQHPSSDPLVIAYSDARC